MLRSLTTGKLEDIFELGRNYVFYYGYVAWICSNVMEIEKTRERGEEEDERYSRRSLPSKRDFTELFLLQVSVLPSATRRLSGRQA